MTDIFRVVGMTCGGCVAAVTRAIKRLDPAAEVSVDLPTGRVRVAGTLARAAVEGAVAAAGFTVEAVAR
ncbi:MAG: heavy-metal-associated domain-containing protein [Stellaceae bacterium]